MDKDDKKLMEEAEDDAETASEDGIGENTNDFASSPVSADETEQGKEEDANISDTEITIVSHAETVSNEHFGDDHLGEMTSNETSNICATGFQRGRLKKQSTVSEDEANLDENNEDVAKLNKMAAASLRQRNSTGSDQKQEFVVEMEPLHRSSVRRDSFILAVQNTEESTEGHVVTSDLQTTGSSQPEQEVATLQTDTDVEGTFPDTQQLDETDRKKNILRYSGRSRRWVLCCLVLPMLAIVTSIILIPQSLVYVEYFEMALARSRLTGRVDRDRTLYYGCYLFFPDTELITFPATAHHVDTELEVTSADGLALGMHLSLQYFIKGEELGKLHQKYGQQYEGVTRRVIESEVKNAVVDFSVEQYRLNRSVVERSVYTSLSSRLQGDCCPSCCPRHCSNDTGYDCRTCNATAHCQPGLHMSLLPYHVQLGAIDIPQDVNERFLRSILLQVEAEKESLIQESKVENKQTEFMTKDIQNRAKEVREEAEWTARKVGLEAEAGAEVTRQRAYSLAMKTLMTGLNITTMDQQLSVLLLLAYTDISDRLHFQRLDKLSLYDKFTV